MMSECETTFDYLVESEINRMNEESEAAASALEKILSEVDKALAALREARDTLLEAANEEFQPAYDKMVSYADSLDDTIFNLNHERKEGFR